MVQTPLDLLNRAAEDANGILGALPGIAADGAAKYVKDGTPSGVIPNLGVGLARAACRRYGANPGALPGEIASKFERICRPYLDDIGEGTGPALELPFRGGQCSVGYRVLYSWQTVFVDGSISPDRTEEFSSVLPGPISDFSFQNQPGNSFIRVTFGNPAVSENLRFSSAAQGAFANARIEAISRADGLPDDCGNPDPEVRQPGPTIVLPPIIPIIIAPDIDVDASVQINIDGTIEFDIGTGPITIDPFGSDDDGGSGGDGGPDDSPPNPEPGPELPGGNGGFGGDDGFGEPPAGRRWVGCCITIVTRPTNQPPIPGSVPEDVYASVVGNVRLVYDASGTRQTDTPVRIQARKVCVWEAVRKLNPVGVRVDLQPGFGYVYRPYSVPLDA